MNTNNQKFLRIGLVLFAKISAWVAFPIIIALYFGKWLDSKTGNENLFFLICTGIAFVVSMIGITRETLKYIENIKNDSKK